MERVGAEAVKRFGGTTKPQRHQEEGSFSWRLLRVFGLSSFNRKGFMRLKNAVLVFFVVTVACVCSVKAGGFDRAIQSASSRVVKLYGLGAGQQEGYGTGILVSSDGKVLTVFSLLLDAQTIRAIGTDGARFEAKVIHRDKERQLALLQLTPTADATQFGYAKREEGEKVVSFSFFDICKPSELSPGDWVLAAGNPFKVADGAEPVSVAHGVFSVRTKLDAMRRVTDFPYGGDVLVIDAITSNPGAPGSAMVNLDGEFVGMVGRMVMSNLTNTHFNYAMPRDVLCEYYREAQAVLSGEQPATGDSETTTAEKSAGEAVDLGIRMSKTGYQRVLPFVERVRPGSVAEKAGVRKDDLVLSVDGKNVGDVAEYESQLANIRNSDRVVLVIRRGRAILDVAIELRGAP